jgi:hypothetical protein
MNEDCVKQEAVAYLMVFVRQWCCCAMMAVGSCLLVSRNEATAGGILIAIASTGK